jgi:uncharacterized protein (TIGR02996 family)
MDLSNKQPDAEWRWPHESSPSEFRTRGFPEGVAENEALRAAVIASPDDDAPRAAYAAWMLDQPHELAQAIGAFIHAQLRVAEAFRADPRAEVASLRSWTGPSFVSTTTFRAGGGLRPWLLDRLAPLLSRGIVGWPQLYRGFVERVAIRARRFLELGDELFQLAPVRQLALIGVPEVVDQLAACPQLARIRSLSLPQHSGHDALSEDTLARLLASPYLGNLAHLRFVQQDLPVRAYASVVTAATTPALSHLEIYRPLYLGERSQDTYQPRSRFERMIAYDTPFRVVRPLDRIAELERILGYTPCVHPEEHYGRVFVDIEVVTEHPIALDPVVLARRGEPVGEGRSRRARRR